MAMTEHNNMFIPKELKCCTTLKIQKVNGNVMDYTDEDSPNFKEVFLKIQTTKNNNKEIICTKTSEVIASWTVNGELNIRSTRAVSSDMSSQTVVAAGIFDNHNSLTSSSIRMEIVPSISSSICCCCVGGGSGGTSNTLEVLVVTPKQNQQQQQQRLIQISEHTNSFQLEFFGGENEKERFFAFLLVCYSKFG